MAEEQAPSEGTPEPVDTPVEGTDEQNIPAGYVPEGRYKEAQAWGTRNAQRAAELEAEAALVQQLRSDDPAEQRAALEALGYQVPDQADEFEQVEQPLTRAEFQQFLQEQQAQSQEQERAQQVRTVVDAQLQEWGLDEEDGNDVLAYAIHALPRTDEGYPDVWAAYERFQKRDQARQKAWRESKRAPHMSPVGTAGTQTPNLDNRQERQDWMASQLMANEQA